MQRNDIFNQPRSGAPARIERGPAAEFDINRFHRSPQAKQYRDRAIDTYRRSSDIEDAHMVAVRAAEATQRKSEQLTDEEWAPIKVWLTLAGQNLTYNRSVEAGVAINGRSN